ncbi:MAG: sterol desaturase family protein [Pseudomonadota bacterium]
MEFFEGWSGIGYILGLLAIALAVEMIVPWRARAVDAGRWLRNASMAFYATIIIGLFPFLASMGSAASADAAGFGLLNVVNVPFWAELALAVIVIDILSYAEHRVLHRWYFFWRTHRTHHSDIHIDATTSLRFHPLESMFRAGIEAAVVFALALPAEGILLSFALSALSNTFTHTNVKLPARFERAMSYLFITPYVHRVHHSTRLENQYSNFGTIFSIWDRLLGTYRNSSNLHADEKFGLDENEKIEGETFASLALEPFRTPDNPRIPRPAGADALAPGEAAIDPHA